jgi:hypothetical protein
MDMPGRIDTAELVLLKKSFNPEPVEENLVVCWFHHGNIFRLYGYICL